MMLSCDILPNRLSTFYSAVAQRSGKPDFRRRFGRSRSARRNVGRLAARSRLNEAPCASADSRNGRAARRRSASPPRAAERQSAEGGHAAEITSLRKPPGRLGLERHDHPPMIRRPATLQAHFPSVCRWPCASLGPGSKPRGFDVRSRRTAHVACGREDFNDICAEEIRAAVRSGLEAITRFNCPRAVLTCVPTPPSKHHQQISATDRTIGGHRQAPAPAGGA